MSFPEETLNLDIETIPDLEREDVEQHLTNISFQYDKKTNTDRLKKILAQQIMALRSPSLAKLNPDAESFEHGDGAKASDPVEHDPWQMMTRMMTQMQKQAQEQQLALQQQQLSMMETIVGAIKADRPGSTDNRNSQVNVNQNRSSNDTVTKNTGKAPDKLEKNTTYRQFKLWEKTWKTYAEINKLDKRTPRDQVNTFFNLCDKDFIHRLHYAFGIKQETTLPLADVLNKIRTSLKNLQNVAVDRYQLVRRKQEPGESFEEFRVALAELAEDADIEEMSAEEWQATLIIHGVRNDKSRQELLCKMPALSLKETINLCNSNELAEKDNKPLKSNGSTHTVNAFSKNKGQGNKNKSKRDPSPG